MSGETEQQISGWTVDTLHSHMLRMLEEMDHRYEQRYMGQQEAITAALMAQKEVVQAALMAADRAVAKAETASEKRFEGVNEFRATLSDQAANLMPRAEAEARMSAQAEKIEAMSSRLDRSEGKGVGMSAAIAFAAGGIGLVIGIAGIVLSIVR